MDHNFVIRMIKAIFTFVFIFFWLILSAFFLAIINLPNDIGVFFGSLGLMLVTVFCGYLLFSLWRKDFRWLKTMRLQSK